MDLNQITIRSIDGRQRQPLADLVEPLTITIVNDLFAIHPAIYANSISEIESSITHIPTGCAFGEPLYDFDLAIKIAKSITAQFGDQLQLTDPLDFDPILLDKIKMLFAKMANLPIVE